MVRGQYLTVDHVGLSLVRVDDCEYGIADRKGDVDVGVFLDTSMTFGVLGERYCVWLGEGARMRADRLRLVRGP
ncbi:hypothetical protein Tco_0767456 [Tanacetum coccineum]|uniref:Uncharacterized protein n=1 Tax=Tanacetum coccineum TaxID=301880 RepID=A0ABQ4ZJR3_9ASTR